MGRGRRGTGEAGGEQAGRDTRSAGQLAMICPSPPASATHWTLLQRAHVSAMAHFAIADPPLMFELCIPTPLINSAHQTPSTIPLSTSPTPRLSTPRTGADDNVPVHGRGIRLDVKRHMEGPSTGSAAFPGSAKIVLEVEMGFRLDGPAMGLTKLPPSCAERLTVPTQGPCMSSQ